MCLQIWTNLIIFFPDADSDNEDVELGDVDVEEYLEEYFMEEVDDRGVVIMLSVY